MNKKPLVSVVLPCRNEEEAIGLCIKQIKNVLKKNKIKGEIIVSDSSRDKSPIIARDLGATIIKHDKKGYGIAYNEGFKIAKGKFLFCADPDGTYDFNEIPRFIEYLENGYDIVIGNRMSNKNNLHKLHRTIGYPFFLFLVKVLHKKNINDIHCGMRAIKKDSLEKLKLTTTGMEFASEMIIKAIEKDMKIKQLTIKYYKRIGESKLRSFSDGWRHIRYILLNKY